MTLNIARTFSAAALAIAVGGIVGCGGGVDGAYTLDKPKKNVDFAKMSREEIRNTSVEDDVDTSLELLPGGKATMKDRRRNESMAPIVDGKPLTTQEEVGTWKLEGESVVLLWDAKEHVKLRLVMRDAMPHKCAKSPDKLTCTSSFMLSQSDSKKEDTTWVFTKR